MENETALKCSPEELENISDALMTEECAVYLGYEITLEDLEDAENNSSGRQWEYYVSERYLHVFHNLEECLGFIESLPRKKHIPW